MCTWDLLTNLNLLLCLFLYKFIDLRKIFYKDENISQSHIDLDLIYVYISFINTFKQVLLLLTLWIGRSESSLSMIEGYIKSEGGTPIGLDKAFIPLEAKAASNSTSTTGIVKTTSTSSISSFS